MDLTEKRNQGSTNELLQTMRQTLCLLLQVEIVEQFLEIELRQRMPSFNMTEFQKQLMWVSASFLFAVIK